MIVLAKKTGINLKGFIECLIRLKNMQGHFYVLFFNDFCALEKRMCTFFQWDIKFSVPVSFAKQSQTLNC